MALSAAALATEAPLSTAGVSGRRFAGDAVREAPELRFQGHSEDAAAPSCERWIVPWT